MEKHILFAFIFNTMLIFNMGLITAANATSDYDNCKRNITVKYTFNYETNETYKEILAAKNAEAEEEYNKWLEETNTTEKKAIAAAQEFHIQLIHARRGKKIGIAYLRHVGACMTNVILYS